MKDLQGRKYAKINEIKDGTILETDGGFTCIKEGAWVEVFEDENGLYFNCSEGYHYLIGQLEDNYYIGLYHA